MVGLKLLKYTTKFYCSISHGSICISVFCETLYLHANSLNKMFLKFCRICLAPILKLHGGSSHMNIYGHSLWIAKSLWKKFAKYTMLCLFYCNHCIMNFGLISWDRKNVNFGVQWGWTSFSLGTQGMWAEIQRHFLVMGCGDVIEGKSFTFAGEGRCGPHTSPRVHFPKICNSNGK